MVLYTFKNFSQWCRHMMMMRHMMLLTVKVRHERLSFGMTIMIFIVFKWSIKAKPSFLNHYYIFLFYVGIDEPVEPRKKNHLLALTLIMAQWRISVLTSIRYIVRHIIWLWSLSLTHLSRMAQLHILSWNWCPSSNQWCQAATSLPKKSLSLCMAKHQLVPFSHPA